MPASTTFRFVFTFVVALSGCQLSAAQQERISLPQTVIGEFPVGYRTINFTDGTDSISVSLWYPAIGNTNKAVAFDDYLRVSLPNLTDQEIAEVITGDSTGLPAQTVRDIRRMYFLAQYDAPVSTSKFPLVFWSSREDVPVYHFPLNELLASHGFVIAHARFKDRIIPRPWQLTADSKPAALDRHLKLLSSAYKRILQSDIVDTKRTAFINWSYPFDSGLLFCQAQEDFDLYIGLSSTNFTIGPYAGSTLRDRLDISRLRTPVVILNEKFNQNKIPEQPPVGFRSLASKGMFISYDHVGHGNFNFLEGMLPEIVGSRKTTSWTLINQESARMFQQIYSDVVKLLSDVVKKEYSLSQIHLAPVADRTIILNSSDH